MVTSIKMKKKIKAQKKMEDVTLSPFERSTDFPFDPQKIRNNILIIKPKIDHTYLFNKWKNLDIDAKKISEEFWVKDKTKF